MNNDSDIRRLQDEVERLLAGALSSEVSHEAELQRRDVLHIAETDRRDQLHIDELGRRDKLHVDERATLAEALHSRDTIGQAKGIIMVTVGCSADEAFRLLKDQSQHENRKLSEVATEIANRAQSKHQRTG